MTKNEAERRLAVAATRVVDLSTITDDAAAVGQAWDDLERALRIFAALCPGITDGPRMLILPGQRVALAYQMGVGRRGLVSQWLEFLPVVRRGVVSC